ncbi:MAG: homoserine O-acetyltransferase MetX [Thermoanaerobaculia bacterium]
MTAGAFRLPYPFVLEDGSVLDGVTVAYRTWGTLDASGSNAVLICHALTGNANADEWWEPLIGAGRSLDPDRDFIVCSNILGSCYGTTGPASIDPATGTEWGASFPRITIRDIVAAQRALIRFLGIHRLRLVVGGSLGGMQVLEWAVTSPSVVEAIAPIATSGRHAPWAIAISEAQRQAIQIDPRNGLAVARMIAMASYRSPVSFQDRFGRSSAEGSFAVERWLRDHGEKLVNRFDPNCYIRLTQAMDSHDLARGRGGYEEVLGSIRQPALIVSIDSDVLYPPAEQEERAAAIPNATLRMLHAPHGHDAFLIEGAAVNELVLEFRMEALAKSA